MRDKRMAIIGLGGGGVKIVDGMADPDGAGPSVVAIDTDAAALERSSIAAKLQIGASRTTNLGTAGDVSLGRSAAEDDREMIRGLVGDAELVMVVVSLGGGTGSGAAPVVVRAAHDEKAATLCLVTLPFPFEGRRKCMAAEAAVEELRECSDALIVMPNVDLFESVGEAGLADSFEKADATVRNAVSAIWKLIVSPGFINIDFAELKRVVRSSGGLCTLGYGLGTGTGKARAALDALTASRFMKDGATLREARSILVSIMGGRDLALQEVSNVMDTLTGLARDDVELFMGTIVDEQWNDRLMVTVITSETGTQEVALPKPSPLGTGEQSPVPGSPESQLEPVPESLEPVPTGSREASRRSRRKRKSEEMQIKLQLETYSRGRFKDVEPTVFDGEDLDIPTFVRRGIIIDK